MKNDAKRTIVWLTNSPAPYRVKLWMRLSDVLDLKVMLLGGLRSEHRWAVERQVEYSYVPRSKFISAVLADYVVVGKWESLLGLSVIILRRLLGKQVSIFYESTLFSQHHDRGPVAWIRRWLFRASTSIITVGRASSEAVRAMGINEERIFEGVNAVDVAEFARQAAQIRLHGNIPDGRKNTIFVGQLIERKNPVLVLEAWLRHADSSDYLYIVGSGPEIDNLRNLANASGLCDRVKFPGYCSGDELVRLYCSSSTLVLPAAEEVWGLVVNEALACGLHVVVSKFAGVASTFSSMEGVYVCDTTVQSVSANLLRSQQDWDGPIVGPEVMKHTPEALADVAISAVRYRRD